MNRHRVRALLYNNMHKLITVFAIHVRHHFATFTNDHIHQFVVIQRIEIMTFAPARFLFARPAYTLAAAGEDAWHQRENLNLSTKIISVRKKPETRKNFLPMAEPVEQLWNKYQKAYAAVVVDESGERFGDDEEE